MSEKPLKPDIQLPTDKAEIFERGREIVLAAPQLYVDVDVEADGIAGHGSMLSIGAQSPTGESFYSEIRPITEDFKSGNREFCEQHGLQRERLLQEAPDAPEVMAKFHAWVTEVADKIGKPPVFTAFNAAFDWAFVDLYFIKAGYDKNPFGIAPFDLKSLALPLTGEWDWSETSKNKLPEIIIPEGDFTHHALEDAQYQQKLHFGMAALLGERKYTKNTMKPEFTSEGSKDVTNTTNLDLQTLTNTEGNTVTTTADIIIDLYKKDFEDSYDGETVGGIQARGGQSPRMKALEDQRDQSIRELLSQSDSNAIALELANRGHGQIVLRYGDNLAIDWNTFGQKLLENKQPELIANNLDRFSDIDRNMVVNALTEKGREDIIINNLDSFPEVNHEVLITGITNRQIGYGLFDQRLDSVLARGVDRERLGQAFINAGLGINVVMNRLDQFPDSVREALAKSLVAQGEFGQNILKHNIDKFPGINVRDL